MRQSVLTAVAMMGVAATATMAVPAQAQSVPQSLPKASDLVARQQTEPAAEYAQYRRYYGGGPRYYGRPAYGPRYYGRPAYGPRYYGSPYYHNNGAAVAAGVAGLAAGALVAGAIASQPAPVAPYSAVSYCAQRYRSYDPASGTYVGYDGLRRACP